MRLATTAMLDQADAAADHGIRALWDTARRLDGHMSLIVPGPVTAGILRRLEGRVLAGQLDLCAHLSPRAPQPAMWAPWASGKVRCPPCGLRALQRIKGTPDEKRCDNCKRVTVTMTSCAVQLPAVVVDLAPLPAFALPPVQVHFGLCSRCHRADQAEHAAMSGSGR